MEYLFYILWFASMGFVLQSKALKEKSTSTEHCSKRERHEKPPKNRNNFEVHISESELFLDKLQPRETDFFDEAKAEKIFSRIINAIIALNPKNISKEQLREVIMRMDPEDCMLSTHRAMLYAIFAKSHLAYNTDSILIKSSPLPNEQDEQSRDIHEAIVKRAHRRFENSVIYFSQKREDLSIQADVIFSSIVDHIFKLPQILLLNSDPLKIKHSDLQDIIATHDPLNKLSPAQVRTLYDLFTNKTPFSTQFSLSK